MDIRLRKIANTDFRYYVRLHNDNCVNSTLNKESKTCQQIKKEYIQRLPDLPII